MDSKINISESNQNLITKGVLWLGGILLGNYVINQYNKNKASDSAFSDVNVDLSNQLYQAGHTWGGLFEDEAKLIEIAGYIKDYAKVSQAYRTKYGVNLDEELNRWLNADEIAQFKARLGTTVVTGGTSGGTGSGGTTTTKTFLLNQAVYFTAANWYLRGEGSPYYPVGVTKVGFAGYVVSAGAGVKLTAKNKDGKTVTDVFILIRNASGKKFWVSKQILK